MPITVGIPRALLYHEFGELWQHFFASLAVPAVASAETNKQILDRGTSLAVDESCLPLKLYLGHVETLLDECDQIFVPRVVSYHHGYYFCAKFAGLPDIVCNTFHLTPESIIAPNLDMSAGGNWLTAVCATARAAGRSSWAGWAGYRQALSAWRHSTASQGDRPGPKIAVIGHSYLLNDSFLCGDIFSVLNDGSFSSLTPADVPPRDRYDGLSSFADVYWQLSAKLVGAVRYFVRRSDVAGLVLVSSFGCGFDSLMNEYLVHHILTASGKPFILLTLDEHTGRAGLVTRVEAFLDLVKGRRKTCG